MEKKYRIVKGKVLADCLVWLGFEYKRDEFGNYVFERSRSFDLAYKDLHGMRAYYRGYAYQSIKKEDMNEGRKM